MANINLGGSIGVPGSVAVLGNDTVQFTSDANLTLTAAQYSNKFLQLTSGVSLTATRNVIAPLNPGQEYVVQNDTTGGQSIRIIGATGTGVTIANGQTAYVVSDGTNYLQPAAGGGTPGGPSWAVQYNNGGALGGSEYATLSPDEGGGKTSLTLTQSSDFGAIELNANENDGNSIKLISSQDIEVVVIDELSQDEGRITVRGNGGNVQLGNIGGTSGSVMASSLSNMGLGYAVIGSDGSGTLIEGTASSGLSGMTAGQVPIAATDTTVTSSKALGGAGAAITTGPASGVTSGHLTVFTGTAGQIADGGAVPTSLPPSGSAGGDLSGTYPNPTVAAVHATSGTLDGVTIGGTTPASVRATSVQSTTGIFEGLDSNHQMVFIDNALFTTWGNWTFRNVYAGLQNLLTIGYVGGVANASQFFGPLIVPGLTLASGTEMTDSQGNGAKVQHSTGSATSGDVVTFDANGNTVDSGYAITSGTVFVPLGRTGFAAGNLAVWENTSGTLIDGGAPPGAPTYAHVAGETTGLSATPLVTSATGKKSTYRLEMAANITTAGTGGEVLCSLNYTDTSGTAQTSTFSIANSALGSGTSESQVIVVNVASDTIITYSTVLDGITSVTYDLTAAATLLGTY